MLSINPDFTEKLKKYGSVDINACYNCGNCTAICPLSEGENSFPRKMLRYSVLGVDSKINTSLEPWLCYYCGECSETCPREANPGELMMSLRRFLTAKYDWTGLSGLFYKSAAALWIGFILVGLAMIGVGYYEKFDLDSLMHFGHVFEQLLVLCVFSLILIPNIIRMYWFTILKNKVKAPISAYIKGIQEFIVHMVTQKNALKCEDNTFRWFEHLLVVFGYLFLLLLAVLLNWYQSELMILQLVGYITSVIIFIFTFDFVISRFRKKKEISKFSHATDWLFVIWLFLMGFTSFLVRIFWDLEILESNVWMYLVHLIVIAQWGILIVPFAKWTHFLYRSFAMCFEKIKDCSK